MTSNRKEWLRWASAMAFSLFLLATAGTLWGQREAKRGRDSGGYGNWGGSAQLRQTALYTGYDEGVAEGREDRRRNERFGFTDESDYRSASKGYSSRLGDRSLYQRYFRVGFENGYRDGWNGY